MVNKSALLAELITLSVWTSVLAVTRPTAITLENNGYKGLLVAIKPDVPQDASLVDKLKAMLTEASAYLYAATDRRAYFSHVTILVPHSWSSDPAWAPATSELYSNADVVLQDPPKINRRKRSLSEPADRPIHSEATTESLSQSGTSSSNLLNPPPRHLSEAATRSYGGCGVAGVRINIFTNIFAPRSKYQGRLFVHEWAKFRWGVFEEFARDGEQQFYFSPTTGNLEAVRCNIHMVGRIYRVNPTSGRAELCHMVDPQTGMYDENCVFSPYTLGRYNDNITASIMDRQYVPTITDFCNDDKSDLKRVHNYESPSRHNRLCGSRSTWDIIANSPDFVNGANSPKDGLDTTPVFKVARLATTRRMILALDTSNSMEEDNKLTRAKQAVTSFIEDALHDNVPLGVVSFSHQAKLISPVQKLHSQKERRSISNRLPTRGHGATSLGVAVLKALEALQQHDRNATNALLVVITDGRETSQPTLHDVMPNITAAGAVVNIICYNNQGEDNLKHLALSTGGRFYLDTERGEAASTLSALMSVYKLLDPGKDFRIPRQILSHAQTLRHHDRMTGRFRIDPSIGNQTTVIFTYSTHSAPDITLVSPTGRKYTSLYPEYSVDPELKKVKIQIPQTAEVGLWTYDVTNSQDPSNMKTSVSVLSSERDILYQAPHLSGSLVISNASWPIKAAVYAEVTQDGLPVVGLKVKATVYRPIGDAVELNLYDGGTGADLEKDDGIYSRYFTSFSNSGRYSLVLSVSDEVGASRLSSHLDPLPLFLESTFAGSVHVDHSNLSDNVKDVPIETDFYPPMRITDLRVVHTSGRKKTVTLAWTAPGDDGDSDVDKASEYVIVCSSNAEDLIRNIKLPKVPRSAVIEGNLGNPRSFGETEMITLQLGSVPDALPTALVLAVLAIDEAGNKADISNLVTVGLGLVPDVTTPEYQARQTKAAAEDPTMVSNLTLAIVVGVSGALLVTTFISTVLIYAIMRTGWMAKDRAERREKSGIV